MTLSDRWLLPDGIEEVLPEQAARLEALRRRLLDTYASWGYSLIIPPLVEFTDSLLIHNSPDLDLQTFKVTDQLTGRTMGIRADITPQAARIDAHTLNRDGPVRLCYAGSVLHTRAQTALGSRSPLMIGAELFGVTTTDADSEVICLMLETLHAAGLENLTLDLGHVRIFHALATQAGLSTAQEHDLLEVMQRKAPGEIRALLERDVADTQLRAMLLGLTELHGERDVLVRARKLLAKAPAAVRKALDELDAVADAVALRMKKTVRCYFDLSELRGYHYHTGIVFAAYAPGIGRAVANGGRYDDVGEVFGRARAATGFSTDLKTLVEIGNWATPVAKGILAELDDSAAQWSFIQNLRAQGETVICIAAKTRIQPQTLNCDRVLVNKGKTYSVKPI